MERNYFTEKENAQKLGYSATTPVQPEVQTVPSTEPQGDVFERKDAEARAIAEERKENTDRYAIKLPDEDYALFNQVIATADTPEEMEKISYSFAQAMKYAEELDIPLDQALQNLPELNKSFLGLDPKVTADKGSWKAICDNFTMGMNTLQMGTVGFQAMLFADEQMNDEYKFQLEKYRALQNDNNNLEDTVKRHWLVEAAKFGAQTAPFTGSAIAAALIPEIGGAVAFGLAFENTVGLEYMELIDNGSSHKVAKNVAQISGLFQSILETALGDVAAGAAIKGAGKVAGKVFTEELRKKIIDNATKSVFKNIHYNGALKKLASGIMRYGMENLEEGFEEFNQSLISAGGKALAAALDGYELENGDFTSIMKQAMEEFKGGFMGSMALGIPIQIATRVVANTVTVAELKRIENLAVKTQSEAEFINQVKDSPIWKKDVTDVEKYQAMHDMYQNVLVERDNEYFNEAKGIAELTQPAEGFEETERDENGDIVESETYRNKDGSLYTQNVVTKSKDGVSKFTYKVGNPTQAHKNLFGYIEGELNENTQTVTIDKFVMSEAKESLRGELFSQFAKDNAGYKIEWDPIEERGQTVKENLIKANPTGQNNGLNYFTDKNSIADVQTRKNVAKQIKKAMPKLSDSQIAADVALLEVVYKSLKNENGYTSFTDYYNKSFGEEIFGDKKTLEEAAEAANKKKTALGGIKFNQTEQSLRAVIYAGKRSNFSTWSHEVAHLFRQQLQGEMLEKAEKAFGIENHNWTRVDEERFAKGFEHFLQTGKAQNESLKPLFRKLAEFMTRVYKALTGHIKFSRSVEEVYNSLLNGGEGNELALAEKAVAARDVEIRQEEMSYAEEQKQKETAIKEQENFEASETEMVENTAVEEEIIEEETAEIEDEQIQDLTTDGVIDNQKVENLVDQIAAKEVADENHYIEQKKQTILDSLSYLPKEEAERIADTVIDPNATLEDKDRAKLEAAGLNADGTIDFYQTIGENEIDFIINSSLRQKVQDKLDMAKKLESTGNSSATTIKRKTDWQRINGEWKFEITDENMEIDLAAIKKLKSLNKKGLQKFNEVTKIPLGAVVTNLEIYKYFPYIKNVNVKFFNNKKNRIGSMYIQQNDTMVVNLAVSDIRKALAGAIQRYIQGMNNTVSYGTINDVLKAIEEVYSEAEYQKLGLNIPVDISNAINEIASWLDDPYNSEVMNTANRWNWDVNKREFNLYGKAVNLDNFFFQDEEYAKYVEEVGNQAYEYLEKNPTQENLGLLEHLKQRKNTAWYVNAAQAVTVRRDMDLLLDGKPIPEDSLFNAVGAKQKLKETCNNYMKQITSGKTREERLKSMMRYFTVVSKFVGSPSKPLFSFDGSFADCRSSKWCATNCYASNGKYGMADKIIFKEMITKLVNEKTKDVAEIVARQYKSKGPWIDHHMPLRINAVGDLSTKQIELIQILNNDFELSTTVFSKRPELLSMLDPKKNVVMLSVDPSNYDLAEQYPDLPLAVVYTGTDMEVEWIKAHEERFKKNHGVILPAVTRNKHLTEEQIKKLPEWAYNNYICEVDAGIKKIGKDEDIEYNEANGGELNLTNCHQCYRNNIGNSENSGCYFMRTISDTDLFVKKFKDIPRKVVDEIFDKEQTLMVEALKASGATESEIRSFIDRLGAIRSKDMAEYDRTRTEGIGNGDGERVPGQGESETGNGEPGNTNSGSTGERRLNEKVDLFQEETDPKTLEWLNNTPTVKAYRSVQVQDGQYYPPMAGKVLKDGKLVWQDPIKFNTWERSEEHPEMVKDGMFPLHKGNNKTIWAIYAPYMHSADGMLNDQFKEAQDRPELVTVEVEIPLSELEGENPYTAEGSKRSVGRHDWPSGIVTNQLTSKRNVNLSRWDKVVRVVPNEEVVQNIDKMLKEGGYNKNIPLPTNTFTPQVKQGLEELGYKFVKTDNKGMFAEGPRKGKSYSHVYNNQMLFQTAYHGTSADFEKFNVDEFGLSGEGSMSFGYGTYLTGSEEIARDYAERQRPYTKNYELDLDSVNGLATYIAEYYAQNKNQTIKERIEAEVKHAQRTYDQAVKEYPNLVETAKHRLDIAKSVTENDVEKAMQTILYTVDIPDNGYIQWDKNIAKEEGKKIQYALYNKLIAEDTDESYTSAMAKTSLLNELDQFSNEINGQALYSNLRYYLPSDKDVSKFLYNIGYKGIEYPAGTNFGTPDGKEARNFVIFNDDDAKIVDKMLFQTLDELYTDARIFDNWQDFMEFYEQGFGKPDPSLVPELADAAWYQTTWELANNISPESYENEQLVKSMTMDDNTAEDEPAVKDALFTTKLQRPGELEKFLKRIYDIQNMDLDIFENIDNEQDAQERDNIIELQDFINTALSHQSIMRNAARLAADRPLTERMRKSLISLMSNNARNYRDAYARLMDDKELALDKSKEKIFNLVDPEVDVERLSLDQRRRLADKIDNDEIAKKIKDGTLLMDGELERHIEYLNSQIKDAENEVKAAENKLKERNMEIQGDYQRIADWETRRLLELHDDLLLAKSNLKNNSDQIARHVKRGIAITGKYEQTSQNLKANYDTIFRKFDDLRKSIAISEEVKAALKERERIAEVKDNLKNKQDDKNALEKVKKMRIQLVKRTLRRVPFSRINYPQARTLIAIQRVLEPNLLGGVNKWIGQEQAYLRGVISQWLTDEEARQRLTKYLETKKTKTAKYILDKLNETKTIEDYNSNWTKQDRQKAHRVLPKENWIRELNLDKLAEERKESVQLDIQERTETRQYKDKDGKIQTQYLTRAYMNPELDQEVHEALGDKLYNQVMAIPFSEWTTEDMEALAKRVDDIYIEGRNLLAAKNQAKIEAADEIRKAIEKAIKDTGIVINDNDDDDTKRRKKEKIEKILGKNKTLAGTLENSDKGFFKSAKQLLNGYGDANVMRVARILDNYSEGINVEELYRKEDQCYNMKARSIDLRNVKIEKLMKENNITAEDLMESVNVMDHEFTVDELLYFKAANMDFEEDGTKQLDPMDFYRLSVNDDYAATSRNAVMFGNMLSSQQDIEFKEECRNEDEQMQKRIENNQLTADERNALELNMLVRKPGTRRYINRCKAMFSGVLAAADKLDSKYAKLLDAIQEDYADQYDRMNRASIDEFNVEVARVKNYVPLIRLESNGDTNENRVREDLLGSYGVGKQWVDKGMTQKRVNIGPLNQKPVETGLYKTWTDSVERTEHFINYAPYVRELNRVYKSRDAQYLRAFIENRYGKGMLHYIDEYINEVANPNAIGTRSQLDNMIRTLRGKTAPAYLAWKTSAVIKQALTSPWPYAQFISPAKYLAAQFDIIRSWGKLWDDIRTKSAFMNQRVFDPMVDVINELAEKKTDPVNHALNQFSKMGMQPLEWIDWFSVAPGWLACYRDKYAELNNRANAEYEETLARLTAENDMRDIISPDRMTNDQIKAQADKSRMSLAEIETQAVEYADTCTRLCQPSNRVVDLAPFFKSKGPNSEISKALLQFTTSLNVIWQNIKYDLAYDVKNLHKNIPEAAKKKILFNIVGMVTGYVMAGIMMNAVTDTPDDDDDEKDKLKKYIWYSTTQFTDAIPVLGQMTSNLSYQMITGKKAYSTPNDLMPMLTKFYKALESARVGNLDKAALRFTEGLGMAAGLPVSGTKELLWAVGVGDGNGDIEPRPDALLGRRSKE